MGKFCGPPMPRPPLMTTRASSSLTFSEASATRSVMCARFEPSPTDKSSCWISPAPGFSDASNDFGLTSTIAGFALAFIEATFAPPKYGTLATNPPSFASTSLAFEIRPTPSLAESRPATSRESDVNAKRIRSGFSFSNSEASASVAGSAM